MPQLRGANQAANHQNPLKNWGNLPAGAAVDGS